MLLKLLILVIIWNKAINISQQISGDVAEPEYDPQKFPENYPFIVFFTNKTTIYCLGTLFDYNYVLTSALCMLTAEADENLEIRTIGSTPQESAINNMETYYTRESNTDSNLYLFDFALVKLNHAIKNFDFMGNLHFNHYENIENIYYVFRLKGSRFYKDESCDDWRDIMTKKGYITKLTIDPYAKFEGCYEVVQSIRLGDDGYCFVVEDKPTIIKNTITGGSIMWYKSKWFISGMHALDNKPHGQFILGVTLDRKKNWFYDYLFPETSGEGSIWPFFNKSTMAQNQDTKESNTFQKQDQEKSFGENKEKENSIYTNNFLDDLFLNLSYKKPVVNKIHTSLITTISNVPENSRYSTPKTKSSYNLKESTISRISNESKLSTLLLKKVIHSEFSNQSKIVDISKMVTEIPNISQSKIRRTSTKKSKIFDNSDLKLKISSAKSSHISTKLYTTSESVIMDSKFANLAKKSKNINMSEIYSEILTIPTSHKNISIISEVSEIDGISQISVDSEILDELGASRTLNLSSTPKKESIYTKKEIVPSKNINKKESITIQNQMKRKRFHDEVLLKKENTTEKMNSTGAKRISKCRNLHMVSRYHYDIMISVLVALIGSIALGWFIVIMLVI